MVEFIDYKEYQTYMNTTYDEEQQIIIEYIISYE